MDFKVQASSDVGRKRDQNQDRILARPRWGVFVLSDGIGGKPGGERASQLIVDAVEQRAPAMARIVGEYDSESAEGREEIFSLLYEEVQDINAAVYRAGRDDAYPRGIGATMDLVVFGPRGAFILHVGDSRVYLLRNGEVFRITQDHTFYEHLKANPDLRGHGDPRLYTHILTRSMGREPRVEADRLYVDIEPGDRCVMCSDGVTDYFRGQEIKELLEQADAEHLAQHLVRAANEAGGKDNSSVIVIDVGDDFQGQFESRSTTRPDTMRRINFINKVGLFGALGFQEALKLLRYVTSRCVEPGDRVVEKGDGVDGLYLVMDGRLEVVVDEEVVSVLEEGAHFGEVGLFGDRFRTADVICREEGFLLVLSTEKLRCFVEQEPVIGVKVLWCLLEQASEMIQRLMAENSDGA